RLQYISFNTPFLNGIRRIYSFQLLIFSFWQSFMIYIPSLCLGALVPWWLNCYELKGVAHV
ncbi:MAG: hypothetical protein V3W19_14240, partial [Desulfatiglandales bacterium]